MCVGVDTKTCAKKNFPLEKFSLVQKNIIIFINIHSKIFKMSTEQDVLFIDVMPETAETGK